MKAPTINPLRNVPQNPQTQALTPLQEMQREQMKRGFEFAVMVAQRQQWWAPRGSEK